MTAIIVVIPVKVLSHLMKYNKRDGIYHCIHMSYSLMKLPLFIIMLTLHTLPMDDLPPLRSTFLQPFQGCMFFLAATYWDNTWSIAWQQGRLCLVGLGEAWLVIHYGKMMCKMQ